MNRPPSEKLSGVTFRMPINSGRSANCKVLVLSFQSLALLRDISIVPFFI